MREQSEGFFRDSQEDSEVAVFVSLDSQEEQNGEMDSENSEQIGDALAKKIEKAGFHSPIAVVKKQPSKSFHTTLPIEDPLMTNESGEEVLMSEIPEGRFMIRALRSVSPVGRSSKKLKSLRKKADQITVLSGRAKMLVIDPDTVIETWLDEIMQETPDKTSLQGTPTDEHESGWSTPKRRRRGRNRKRT